MVVALDRAPGSVVARGLQEMDVIFRVGVGVGVNNNKRVLLLLLCPDCSWEEGHPLTGLYDSTKRRCDWLVILC
jgi:hypothetical protein